MEMKFGIWDLPSSLREWLVQQSIKGLGQEQIKQLIDRGKAVLATKDTTEQEGFANLSPEQQEKKLFIMGRESLTEAEREQLFQPATGPAAGPAGTESQPESNLGNMSTEELQEYGRRQREELKGAEALRDEALKMARFPQEPSPPSPPLTLEAVQHRRALLEAAIVDAAIKKAQEETRRDYDQTGARIERIQQGQPQPGDLPWEEPQARNQQVTTSTRERKMFPTDRTCASCGAQNIELPFPNPDPNRPVYCLKCNAERRSQRGRGTLVNQELRARKEELDQREDELQQTAAVLDKAKTGGKLSKKEQKLLRRLKQGESGESEEE